MKKMKNEGLKALRLVLTWNTVFSMLPISATEAGDAACNDYHENDGNASHNEE